MIELTLLEVFNQTVRHLRSMPGPSTVKFIGTDEGPLCAYRGEEGRRCAVGYWIKDEDYSIGMEGRGIRSPSQIIRMDSIDICRDPILGHLTFVPDRGHVLLLKALQGAHDAAAHNGSSGWDLPYLKRELCAIAKNHDLSEAVIDDFQWGEPAT